jgi:uncharacterized RDD family membrane protein YckC
MSENLDPRNYADYVPQYVPEPDPYEYRVGFLRRLGAYIIDTIIVMLLITIALFATGQITELVEAGKDLAKFFDDEAIQIVINSIVPVAGVISLVYFSSELFVGASLGKMLLNIRIGSDDRYPASFPKLLARYSIKNVGVIASLIAYAVSNISIDFAGDLIQFLVYIGFLFTIASRRQGFHDMLSATAVYYTYEIIEDNNQ